MVGSKSGVRADRYQRLKHLGDGASGAVWLVADSRRSNERVALKELAPEAKSSEASLRTEFATLSAIRHPNFVKVLEFDNDPASGLPRFTMEYVDGSDLVTTIRQNGREAFVRTAVEALRAVGFLHDFGLVHRDIKPSNILVRSDAFLGARVVFLDFGLARFFRGADKRIAAAGTLPYMAPELFSGAAAGPRSDLFSLGAVFHEAVYGVPPYGTPDSSDVGQFIGQLSRGERVQRQWPEDWPSALRDWLEELLASDPSNRPAKASESLASLNRYCQTSLPGETPETRRARLAFGTPPGRQPEIEQLWNRIDSTTGPSIVWLCGEAGLGKTRMLNWIGAEAVRRGWTVVRRQGTESAPRFEPNERQLILLDEVESATGDLAAFARELIETPAAANVRVVASVRPTEVVHADVRDLLERAGRAPAMHRIDLPRLDVSGLREMVERATGTSASETRLRWLLEATEGNPLIAESLIVAEAWERGDANVQVQTLEATLTERIDALSPESRRWLEACCVLELLSSERLISDVSGLDGANAHRVAPELVARGFVKRTGDRLGPDSRVLARHVLANLDTRREVELHRRAAELLSAEPLESDPWRLAIHLYRSGSRDKAIAYAVKAAESAIVAEDPSTAADRFALAVRCLPRRRDERRATLRLRQAEALMDAGRNREAVRAFGGLAASATSPSDRIRAILKQGRALTNIGRLNLARLAAERARERAAQLNDGVLEAEAHMILGMIWIREADYESASAALARAVEGLRESAKFTELAESLHFLAWCESRLYAESAHQRFEEALKIYRASADPRGELRTMFSLSGHLRLTGHLDEAARMANDMKSLAERLRDPTALRLAITNLAHVAQQRGEYDRAAALATEIEGLAKRFGESTAVVQAANIRADSLIGGGRPGAATEDLRARLGNDQLKYVNRASVGFAYLTMGEALMEARHRDEREVGRYLSSALRTLRFGSDAAKSWRARALSLEWRIHQGAFEKARALTRSLENAPENNERVVGFESKTRFHIAKARLLIQQERYDDAERETQAAVELAGQGDQPAFAAVAHAVAAEACEAKGDDRRAEDHVREGRVLLERAAQRIEDAEMRRDFLARPVFRRLREQVGEASDARLLALYDMVQALNSERDIDRLLESILDMALKVVQAERGMILLLDPDDRTFSVRLVRNLEEETEKDAEAFSRGVIERAGSGESVLAVDAGRDDRFRSLRSVSLFGIRSLMCVPLRLRDRIVGTVYLDSRSGGTVFTREDLRFVEAFADHAALALDNAREIERLALENVRLRREAESKLRFENLVGESPAMQRVFALMGKVAESELSVLIQGESGTGKELVARAIHFHGPRRGQTFLTENCASIPETLLESELFGHVRGAFTGAERDRTGLFEEADGGTLFLDEVGDMSPAMQARLLRVLQEGEIRRVGGNRPITVDVRVIAASHRDLEHEVEAGRFREDLLYRLKVLVVRLPPLRERVGDIRMLVDFLLGRMAAERGRDKPRISAEVLERFERYRWPGNVRQLQNVLQRLALLAGSGPVDLSVLEADRELGRLFDAGRRAAEPIYSLEANERERIRSALEQAAGNRSKAARMLGISRATIYRKLREYDLG